MSEYKRMISFVDAIKAIDETIETFNDIANMPTEGVLWAFVANLKTRLESLTVGVPVENERNNEGCYKTESSDFAWMALLLGMLFAPHGFTLDNNDKHIEALEKQFAEYEAGRKEREKAEYQKRIAELERRNDELKAMLNSCRCNEEGKDEREGLCRAERSIRSSASGY